MVKDMLTEELVEKLKKCDPKIPVRIECWQDSTPRGVFKVSSAGNPDFLVIADQMAHYEDDDEIEYIIKEVQ